jgi:hypothetical protein
MFNLQMIHRILNHRPECGSSDDVDSLRDTDEQNKSGCNQTNQHANWHLMSPEGTLDLRQMLENMDNFEIQTPEHGALLTVAWFLREGHFQAAEEVLQLIVPFFDYVRFYPSKHTVFEGGELMFSSRNVHDLILSLEEYTFEKSLSTNARRRRFANALGLAWKDWKHHTIHLMNMTLSCAHIPAYKTKSSCAVSFGKMSNRSNFTKAEQQQGPKPTPYIYHDCPYDCGRPLVNFTPESNEQAEYLYARCQVLESLHEFNGTPFKQGTSAHTLIKCLRAYVMYLRGAQSIGLANRDVGLLRNIIAGSNTSHGLLGSDMFAHYIAPFAESIHRAHHIIDQHLCASEMIRELNTLDRSQGICDPVEFLGRMSHNVPVFLQRLVFDTVRGSVQNHVYFKQLQSSDDLVDMSFDIFREILDEPPTYARHQLMHALNDVGMRTSPYTSFAWTLALRRVEDTPTEADIDAVNRTAAGRVVSILLNNAHINFPHQEWSNRFFGRLQFFSNAAGFTCG